MDASMNTQPPIRQLRIAAMNMVMAARADRNVSAECYRYADALQTAIDATKELEQQSNHPTPDREGLIEKLEAMEIPKSFTPRARAGYLLAKEEAIAIIRQHESDHGNAEWCGTKESERFIEEILARPDEPGEIPVIDDDLIEAICLQSCKRIATEDGIRSCASACETCKRELREFIPELRPYLATREPVSLAQCAGTIEPKLRGLGAGLSKPIAQELTKAILDSTGFPYVD